MIAAFANAWHAAWRTLAFGRRLGSALLLAAVAFVAGVFGGEILLDLFGAATGLELPYVVRELAIGLVAFGFAGLAFAGRLFGPATASDVMGSARWATRREVRAALAAPALARNPAALLVGRGHRGELLRYAGPAHLLTIAPTRSGKGVGTVLPNLLAADRPVVCVDPKGENARIAARARRRFGPVWVLDPFGASGLPASCYDPTAALDPHSPDLADDAATLADALVHDPPGQVSEAHWNEEARALIAGLLMHLACEQGRGGPGSGPEGLPALRRLLTLPPREWDALLASLMADTGAAGAWSPVPPPASSARPTARPPASSPPPSATPTSSIVQGWQRRWPARTSAGATCARARPRCSWCCRPTAWAPTRAGSA
jgi:type IV secretion system protein VirD4